MRTSSQFSTSNSSFFTRVKNRFGSASRLGLTTIAALALVVAVSASSSKNTDQSKKAGIDAASSSLLTSSKTSSKTVAAQSGPVVSFANKLGQYQQSVFHEPDATQAVLYDQTDMPAANATVSQNFEAANDAFDNQLADDFVVPTGGWTIGEVDVGGVYFNGPGPATSVNVTFYDDAAGLPGAVHAGGSYPNATITSGANTGSFNICLPTPLTLGPGHYWVSVQANLNFTPGGEWGWTDRVVTSNSPAAWQNPGGGFGTPCTPSWGARGPTCGIDNGNNDQIFRLLTPPAGGCPVSIVCPTCPPYVTTTMTGIAIVPGTTDIGNHCDDCPSPITLPFAVTLFGTTYPAGTVIQASSNGSLDFIGSASPFGTSCPLPDSRIDRSILPFQGDLRTDNISHTGEGIFTAVVGTNFIIEWRAEEFSGGGQVNFEIVLHSGSNCFDVVYGVTSDSGASHESGVQRSPTGPATQFSCLTATLTPGLKVTYCPNSCPAPVPTSAVSQKNHGACGTFGVNLPLVPCCGAVGIEPRQQGAASPVVLWYNGDLNNVNGLANEQNTAVADAHVYDNFIVPAGPGWDIGAVFSDDLSSTVISGATWEIRTGVSSGVPGTLVASGTTPTPTVTPTGRMAFGFTEFQVEVPVSPTVHLAPGTYWLNVTVVGNGTGRAFDSQTSGANAVGMPPGNDMNAFFNSTTFAANFLSTCDPSIGQCADFSMGVKGTVGGVGGFNHQVKVTFGPSVTVASVSVASLTGGSASVAGFTVMGNMVIIDLTGVTNAQRLCITLHGVCDGTVQGDVVIGMGILAGDVNGSGTVNATDKSLVVGQLGMTVTAANFTKDVNANCAINAGDKSITAGKSGTGLPPCPPDGPCCGTVK